MTGFSAQWLELREPADRRARHDFLGGGAELIAAHELKEILDLGCGTGANFRFLAPRLAASQHWTCIDHDAALLARFAAQLGAPDTTGDAVAFTSATIDTGAAHWRATLDLRCEDLAAGIERVALPTGALVTASALLDLVGESWLDAVVARCAAARAPALFALTYDGRIECAPADPFDAELRAHINAHQRRDKGFGPALGPTAPAHAEARLRAAGFRVATAPSDWHLGAREASLQRALIEGWVEAAREIDATPALERWRTRRLAEIDRGRLTLVVGHVDLVAAPAL